MEGLRDRSAEGRQHAGAILPAGKGSLCSGGYGGRADGELPAGRRAPPAAEGRHRPCRLAPLARHRRPVHETLPGGTLYALEECPFSGAHEDGAFAIQFANGTVYAGCHHVWLEEGCNEDAEEIGPEPGEEAVFSGCDSRSFATPPPAEGVPGVGIPGLQCSPAPRGGRSSG